MCSTELNKIPWNFFLTWREGKGTVKECESVTVKPPYFNMNVQKNPMSVEDSWLLPGSLYVISPYLLLDLESQGLNDCRGTLRWATVGVFSLVLELQARAKEHGRGACSVPLN